MCTDEGVECCPQLANGVELNAVNLKCVQPDEMEETRRRYLVAVDTCTYNVVPLPRSGLCAQQHRRV